MYPENGVVQALLFITEKLNSAMLRELFFSIITGELQYAFKKNSIDICFVTADSSPKILH